MKLKYMMFALAFSTTASADYNMDLHYIQDIIETSSTGESEIIDSGSADVQDALAACLNTYALEDISSIVLTEGELEAYVANHEESMSADEWSSAFAMDEDYDVLINSCMADAGYTDAKISLFHGPDGEVIAMGAEDILGGIDITEGFNCMGEVHGQYMQCMTDVMKGTTSGSDERNSGLACCTAVGMAAQTLCGTVLGRGVLNGLGGSAALFGSCTENLSVGTDELSTEGVFGF